MVLQKTPIIYALDIILKGKWVLFLSSRKDLFVLSLTTEFYYTEDDEWLCGSLLRKKLLLYANAECLLFLVVFISTVSLSFVIFTKKCSVVHSSSTHGIEHTN